MSDSIGGISLNEILAAAMGNLSDSDNEIDIQKKDINIDQKSIEFENSSIDPMGLCDNPMSTQDTSRDNIIDNPSESCNISVVERTAKAFHNVINKEEQSNVLNSTKDSFKKNSNIYDWDLHTFISNVHILNQISQSYNELLPNVRFKLTFEKEVKGFVQELFPKGISFECDCQYKCSVNIDKNLINIPGIRYGISDNSYMNSNRDVLEYPIPLDCSHSFSLLIRTDKDSRKAAENFVQNLMYNIAKKENKGNVRFRCADGNKGGQSYGRFISLINSNKLFGKGIFTTESSISKMISEIDQISEDNISVLKGKYSSVYEYNKLESKKIPITVAIFFDTLKESHPINFNELNKIVDNSQNTGISTIFVVDNSTEKVISNPHQMLIEFCNDIAYIVDGNNKAPLITSEQIVSDKDFEIIEKKLNDIEKVDTKFASHYDLNNLPLFTKDSTDGLKIPFAFDNDNNFVELELGDITPHALLSGSTGSGKSVTLHAIINQIMVNYHPADVEIWAIDYKAVEFGYYVNKRTPHITVIGQDNSEDFTFGLIDLIKKEYERRKSLFVQNNVKDFKSYRKVFGTHSISRLLIVIDEFHNMTQAISTFNGEKDYKKILENLLSEMRAMGMSFLFCSQTIAAGLSGLTEKGRNQIGCRLSMKHQDINEIKETLSLSSNNDLEYIKYLKQGELIYKKISNKPDEPPYSLERVNVLFTEPYRDEIIEKVNSTIEYDYVKREEIICKNSNRYDIQEKLRHPITQFICQDKQFDAEMLTIFPGAPTSLDDYMSINLDSEAGNNILVIGENDSMREAIVIHSVLSMLIDPLNKVIVSILDVDDSDNQRLYNYLKRIKSNNLEINYGYTDVMKCISSIKKITPCKNRREIYLWYGLNKLKNLIFVNSQDEEEQPSSENFEIPDKIPMNIDEFDKMLSMIEDRFATKEGSEQFSENLTYDDCKKIIGNLEEFGPENNRYCYMIFNTFKGMSKARISKVENYEYRIGLKMSTDDSYDLFGSTSFISKADDTTAVLFNGSKISKTIRPYLIPNDKFIIKFNKKMEEI